MESWIDRKVRQNEVVSEESGKGVEWKCSGEMKGMLKRMGVYDLMKELMESLMGSSDPKVIYRVKSRLEALERGIRIMKAAGGVAKDEGDLRERSEGFGDISVSLKRGED